MTKKRKFSREFKESVLNEHDETGISYWKLGKKYGIDARTIRMWRNNRNAFGAESLERHNCSLCNYTADYKKKVVEYCLNVKATCQATALKFGILAPSTVSNWVKQYNSHIELTLSRPDGKERSMANKIPVRKTSFEVLPVQGSLGLYVINSVIMQGLSPTIFLKVTVWRRYKI